MTSLFERDATTEMPIDLLGSVRGGVALLEFMAVEAKVGLDAAAAAEDEADAAKRDADRSGQFQAMLAAAREDTAAEVRRALSEDFTERLRLERQRVEQLLADFAAQRELYFTQAEAAVVRLALMITAKILQHEVNVDSMLLSGTVRAALSRIQDGSTAILRVRPEEADGWKQVLSREGLENATVAADRTLRPGDCVLDTTIGKVELGVLAQLGEVERCFRELLDRGRQ